MATAQDIIDGAWRKARITSPTTANRNNGLIALNDLLTSWSAEGLLVYQKVEETFTIVVGTAIYTWGSGGTITTARPIKVVDAFLKDSSGTDYHLDVNMSMEVYNSISVKSTSGRPTRLYFASEYPLAKIKFDVTPSTADTLYLYSVKPMTEFAALSTTFAMPPEYKRALIYNLAIELAPEEDVQLPQEVFAIARESKKTLERNNARPVNPVSVDDALFQVVDGTFDITTG